MDEGRSEGEECLLCGGRERGILVEHGRPPKMSARKNYLYNRLRFNYF